MMYRYSWSEQTVGFVMAAVGLCAMVVQGGLIGPAVKYLGETKAMIVGLVFGVAGFAVVRSGDRPDLWFLAGVPLLALWGIASAATLGLMSRHVARASRGSCRAPMRA